MNEFATKVITGTATVLGILGMVAGIGLLLAFPIKWTWNATMPAMFALPTITWGKAWCLNFLCHSLVKASQINNNSNE